MTDFYARLAYPPESCRTGMAALRIPPVSPDETVRTAATPPRVLVLSETQGLFLGTLASRESRSVTLSPCRRLRDPCDPDIPDILYGEYMQDGLSDTCNIPEVTLLDATVIVPAPKL